MREVVLLVTKRQRGHLSSLIAYKIHLMYVIIALVCPFKHDPRMYLEAV